MDRMQRCTTKTGQGRIIGNNRPVRFLLSLVLLAWAGSGLEAAAPRTIVFFGDSLTAGYGLENPAAESYPSLVAGKIAAAGLPWRVVNAGVSGDTSAGGKRRIDWVLRQPVDILVLELGANDGLRGLDPAVTRANLTAIIDRVRDRQPSARVVLAGMQMPPSLGEDYTKAYAAVFPTVAQAEHVALIPFLLDGVGGRPELNQADGLHPTAAGDVIVAETVWRVLSSPPLMRARSRLFLLGQVAAAFLVAAGCARRETPAEAGRRTQTLLLGNGAEPQDLDPQTCLALTDYNILLALFEGLTCLDEKTSQPVPGVAERWEVSADGLAYTFHLRADARWSDGDPLTADDFLYSFRRILSPGLGSEYSYLFYPIRNAEAYNTGKLADFAAVGVSAPDAHTLRLELGHPCPYLPALAALPSWFPVHRATIEKFGRPDQRGTAWTRPGNLVGNGPFVLAEWSPNARIVVAKNPQYWDAAHTTLNAVVFFPDESIATDENTFRAGQLHLTNDLLPDRIAHYRQTAPDTLRIDPLSQTYFLRFNVTRPPLDDPRVRQALGRAIDRAAIARDVLLGSRQPAYALTPPEPAATPRPPGCRRILTRPAGCWPPPAFPAGRAFPTSRSRPSPMRSTPRCSRPSSRCGIASWGSTSPWPPRISGCTSTTPRPCTIRSRSCAGSGTTTTRAPISTSSRATARTTGPAGPTPRTTAPTTSPDRALDPPAQRRVFLQRAEARLLGPGAHRAGLLRQQDVPDPALCPGLAQPPSLLLGIHRYQHVQLDH